MKNSAKARRWAQFPATLFCILAMFVSTSLTTPTDPIPARMEVIEVSKMPEVHGFEWTADTKPLLLAEVAPNVLEVQWMNVLESIKDTTIREYVRDYWQVAVYEYRVNGYRPSMKVAQAIIECGAGTSSLARKHNAHFGIKAGWNSDLSASVVVKKDDTPRDVFNTYDDPTDSWRDHTLLMQLGRYKRTIEAETLEQACYQLGVSGYATSQYKTQWRSKDGGLKYGKPGSQILACIKRHNLQALDVLVGIYQ